ncbi:sensor histidine kinase [Salinibacterium sp. dk2585]|uniref:sensor histidine kinase n=1 Tax=unclassified Salinibacterium TaxID=2632331 RepID=UPI0011C25073|nr:MULTISPECIES: sensor histidine kinase [unclassified Salinibacterium]QEE61919.1 sensor histidine kinase [Salinibacterium sp. dk2585]TXK54526.1 sensor histidine kinase [Salinibacterium sp. dk5596]
MPLRVPPRSIAAGIRLQAATRASWVLAAVVLVEHGVVTAEYFLREGSPELMLTPFLAIVCAGAMLAVLALWPGWLTATAYLAVGSAAIVGYVLEMERLEIDPSRIVLVGTIGTAIALTGAAAGGALGGAVWSLAGTLLAQVAVIGAQLRVGMPIEPDTYALLIGLLYFSTYLLMWFSDRTQQQLVDTEPIAAEVEREEYERQRERRAAVVVHETVLRDLALIAHGPLSLTDYDRARLRRDLDEIRAWRSPIDADAPEQLPESDFYGIIREFQWSGLSVDVGGNSYMIDSLAPDDREALLGAMRAALDNALQHSGRATAEVFIDHGTDRLTVMVVDDGHGFDPELIADDRLGIRMAIVRRIEDQGGSVTLWSSPGAGTSVVISLPVTETMGAFS